jgi:hypothetical protein
VSTQKFDPTVFVPGILSAIKGFTLTREALGMSLQELGREIAEGKHIPDDALTRAYEDQKLLVDLFKRSKG